MIAFYAERFDTVELNTTFYRLPPEQGVREWRAATPDDFVFSSKGSRFITHMKKLKDPETAIEKYLSRVELLGPKLGPIVFQLPPFWDVNLDRLAHFLTALPPQHRYAFEFRNPSWHSGQVYSLLERHNAAWCPFDLAGFQSPVLLTTDFIYVRLHGPGAAYQGSYSGASLEAWAARIDAWRKQLKGIYAYFDNDIAGFAPANARALKNMIG